MNTYFGYGNIGDQIKVVFCLGGGLVSQGRGRGGPVFPPHWAGPVASPLHSEQTEAQKLQPLSYSWQVGAPSPKPRLHGS